LGSTRLWRGIFKLVAMAVTLKPSGTVGFSSPQAAGCAIFMLGSKPR